MVLKYFQFFMLPAEIMFYNSTLIKSFVLCSF